MVEAALAVERTEVEACTVAAFKVLAALVLVEVVTASDVLTTAVAENIQS